MDLRGVFRLFVLVASCLLAAWASAGQDGKLSAGDRIHITCVEEPLIDRDYRITQKGYVLIDFIGAVKVAGLTKAEAADAVSDKLVSSRVLKKASVKVDDVVSSPAPSGSVVRWVGEVENPGSVAFHSGMTLGEVWPGVKPKPTADLSQVTVTNPASGSKTVNLSGDALESVVLSPGDVITVGVRTAVVGKATVTGDVSQPGSWDVGPYTTLGELVGRAGGLKDSGNPDAIRLDRVTGDSRTLKLPDDASVRILPGDRLAVGSKLARFLVSVTGRVQKPGMVELVEGQGVLDAIDKAGGFAKNASKDRVKLFASGQTEARIVNVFQIEEGFSGDIPVKAGSRLEVTGGRGSSNDGLKVAAGAALLIFLLGR